MVPDTPEPNIVDILNQAGGQHASIINADPFPKLIKEVFTNIPDKHYGYALLFNISMETVPSPDNWRKFQEVWLNTYCDNYKVKNIYILLPVQDEANYEPCSWTNIDGLISMVSGFENRINDNPDDIERLRNLCSKTLFSTIPLKYVENLGAGAYAFGIYLILPEHLDLPELLNSCIGDNGLESIESICRGLKMILGAGIDSPYSEITGDSKKYSYKFLIVVPNLNDIEGKPNCIMREHILQYSKLWANRTPLRIPKKLEDNFDAKLSFIKHKGLVDSSVERCVSLDYSFLWYHIFLKPNGAIKKGISSVNSQIITSARNFLEGIKGGAPGTIKDSTLLRKVENICNTKDMQIANKKRINDFIMASDENWDTIRRFMNKIESIIIGYKNDEVFKEKSIGFRIWGKPSSGKTFLFEQWRKELEREHNTILKIISLDELSYNEYKIKLNECVVQSKINPILVFIDEVDKISKDATYYDDIIGLTKAVINENRSKIVLVIAGSSPKNIEDMDRKIQKRSSGPDLLERTNVEKINFPDYSINDRLYIAADTIYTKSNKTINKAECIALLLLATSPAYSVSDIVNQVTNAIRICIDMNDEILKANHIYQNYSNEIEYFKDQFPLTFKKINGLVVQLNY